MTRRRKQRRTRAPRQNRTRTTQQRRQAQPEAVLTASSPEDLLAVVPYRLGFHPENSMVVVALSGPRNRFGFTARVDLPPLAQIPGVARYLVDVVRQQSADAVVLVAYAADDAVAGPLTETMRQWLERADVAVVEAIRSDGLRWFSYTCRGRCCPVEGTPYDLSAHPLVAEHVLQGQVALPDRDALRQQVAPVPQDRLPDMEEAFARAEDELVDQPAGSDVMRASFLRTRMAWVRQFVEDWLVTPRPVTDDEAARLAMQVALVPVRDLAWSMMSREAAHQHLELWQQVLVRAIPPYEPAVACLTAFAAWLDGNGALAWCAVERALEADPDYSWAGLIVQSLECAVPPSTWQPMPLEEIERSAS